MAPLLSFQEAAKQLNVPTESLRRVADAHGKTIRMGRALRLHPNDLEELIDLCRVEPKGPASTGTNDKDDHRSGKSETPATCESRPALTAAQRLKASSRNTSSGRSAPVVQLGRRS